MQFSIKSSNIETYRNSIVIMKKQNDAVKSNDNNQYFDIYDRVELVNGKKSAYATVYLLEDKKLSFNEILVSKDIACKLSLTKSSKVSISHAKYPISVDLINKKIEGQALSYPQIHTIVQEIVDGKLTDIELTAFVVTGAVHRFSDTEVGHLINAMVDTGERISFDDSVVVDKHSIGGVPGNKTTPIIVPILADAGVTIPKSSSRAVTSACGTADLLDVFTQTEVSIQRIKRIVNKTGGCMVWGGSMGIVPADDIIISVEHPLSIDTEDQMIASVLAKKKAVGSKNVLIDIPVGDYSKIQTKKRAVELTRRFKRIGKKVGLDIDVIVSDASQPVGFGIGPVPEAIDVVNILQNKENAPLDLKRKSLVMAGKMLEMAGVSDNGYDVALNILEKGRAYRKFLEITREQGKKNGMHLGKQKHQVIADRSYVIRAIDNKRLTKLARILGCPRSSGSGIILYHKIGDSVKKGDVLLRMYSNSSDRIQHALEYMKTNSIINPGKKGSAGNK